jgi:outer membrane protein assembly factor BamB/tetratricopeptide (TPR) repeat protein
MSLTIFCPECDTLLLDAPACTSCGWRRPPPAEAGTRVWHYNAGAKLRCTSMVFAGGRLFFGDAGRTGHPGAVHAVDAANGEGLWRTPLSQGAPSDSLAHGLDRVFISSTEAGDLSPDKPLLAFDAATGELAWTYRSGALNLSAPLLHGGLIYVVSSDRKLHAVDAVHGKGLWTAELSGWGRSAAMAGEGQIFVGTEQNRLLALNLANGRERWSFEGGAWFAATPTVHGDRVYAACWDGTLYALEAGTGKLAWRFDLGDHAYLLTSPLVAGEQVFVGSRDHCLYAVDRRSGSALWRFETGRRVYAAPAVAHGLVYLASDDRHVYALDEETGELAWKLELPGRVRTSPLAVGHHLFVACGGGEVLALALASEEEVGDPQEYLDRQEYAKAAAALALAGEWAEAARLYVDPLQQPSRAAQLYQQAGDAMRAARQYERADQPDRALELWRELDKTEAVVRLLQTSGRTLEAAQELEQADELEAAAELYDKELNQPAKAADLYRKAGKLLKAAALYARVGDVGNEIELLLRVKQPEEAAKRYEELGEYARAAELYLEARQPAQAAAMWSRRGEHRKAAEMYEKAGDQVQAAACYENAGAWALAANLYLQLGEPAEAARCYEAQEAFLLAGTHYQDAALKLEEESQGKAEQRLADLFERAANCFAREYEVGRCDQCRQKVRYYRHQPNLSLVLKQEEAFVQDAYNVLALELINHGRGVAQKIEVALVPAIQGTFAGELTKAIRGIGRFQAHADTLAVLPQAPGKLTLDLHVHYQDRQGQAFEERGRWFVEVRSEPESGRFTPQEVHVHGDYVAGEKVSGDYIGEGGQKGDKVQIQRGGPSGPRLSIGEGSDYRCPDCGARQSVGAAFCEQCGARLEEKR